MVYFLTRKVKNMVDRRKNIRMDVQLPIEYNIRHRARACNLCSHGIMIRTTKCISKGSILFLFVHLPSVEEPLRIIGEVRWSRPAADSNCYSGIEFFFVDRQYKSAIIRYLEQFVVPGVENIRDR